MRTAPSAAIIIAIATAAGLSTARPKPAQGKETPHKSFVMAASGFPQEHIVAAEREGLEALRAGDVDHFGVLTADEAVLVDAHGPATKAQVLKNVAGFTLTDYSIENVNFVPISKETGLISYKITEKGNSHGHGFSAQAYVSSVWTHRGDRWLCLFSQETPARQ
jgi:ketosteroid isomerase-like protein